ncbi:hypothetical protein NPIL_626811 [Nephila pilipes]|uniref:Uncharacterized protein n=1 Tax=Nephila pilipes TaxID=299642 RepID=A0A8X6TFC5_NEPPI|nr:hypothetical protein NPIL_23081 [Nephila pilipes]GFU37696.1 hypothetical protein NPIL_626811 [Nephila pilipes]
MSLRPAHPLSTSPRAFNKSETYREAPLEGGRTYLQETAAKNRTVKRKAKKTQQWKNLGWKRRGGRENEPLHFPSRVRSVWKYSGACARRKWSSKKMEASTFWCPPPPLAERSLIECAQPTATMFPHNIFRGLPFCIEA